MIIGKTLSVDELLEMGYKAVFIGSGAGLPSFMGIEGEDLIGVYSANEYLTRTNLMKAYLDEYDTPIIKSNSVAVVGGGNVAMDAARCAKRLGAEKVFIVYRRGLEEMPARKEEIHHAMEEGVIFRNLNNPVKINGDENGRVKSMECVEMELGEPDDSGRRRPVVKEGSNFELEVDTVIMAIGTSPNPLIRSTTEGLETNRRGCLIVNEETMQTTREGVYAGGDAVTGAATAMRSIKMFAICTCCTSLVVRVISDGVENLSRSAIEKPSTLLYTSVRIRAESPVETDAAISPTSTCPAMLPAATASIIPPLYQISFTVASP